jgi:DNA-binding MarR family transcriptional regulator
MVEATFSAPSRTLPRPTGLAAQLVDAFDQFGYAYTRWKQRRTAAAGLSHARLRLLGALRCGGPRIMSELSEELQVTPRNVTALVDALEHEGLVERRPHPTDRRATIVAVTPLAEARCDQKYLEYAGAMAELFSELPAADQRELLRLLTELREAMRRRDPKHYTDAARE